MKLVSGLILSLTLAVGAYPQQTARVLNFESGYRRSGESACVYGLEFRSVWYEAMHSGATCNPAIQVGSDLTAVVDEKNKHLTLMVHGKPYKLDIVSTAVLDVFH